MNNSLLYIINIKQFQSASIQGKMSLLRIQLQYLLNYFLLIFVLWFPIASIFNTTNFELFHNYTNVLIYLVLLCCLSFRKIKQLFSNKLFLSIILLSILILVSLNWSESHPRCFYGQKDHYYVFYKSYFLLPFLILVFILKKEFIPILINVFLISMFINEAISYGIYFEFWDTKAGSPHNPVPFHLNHITYSTFVGFAILISIYKFFHIKNKYLLSFYFILFISMSINLFMSYGRTGQFSLIITFICLILIYFFKKIKKLLISLCILILVVLFMYYNVNTFNKRVTQAYVNISKVFNNKNVDTSIGTRIMAFSTIPYLINKDNVLLGVGIGDKPTYVSETLSNNDYPYRLINFDIHGYLHNSHLEILVSNGIIGLFLYLLIFYYLLKIKIQDKFIQYLAYTTSIYFFCYGLTADIFFFHHVTILFSVFLGIMVSQNISERYSKINYGELNEQL